MTKRAIFPRARHLALVIGSVLLLSACGGEVGKREFGNPNVQAQPPGSAGSAGAGGFNLFGVGGGGGGGAGIGVNEYLWRASLDTISFMPLVSADPFGGVIITDWYSPPNTPFERFKMVVYILDTRLRVDGVKVNVFRQQLVDNTDWKDAAVNTNTGTDLENAILTRARQLRIQALSGQ